MSTPPSTPPPYTLPTSTPASPTPTPPASPTPAPPPPYTPHYLIKGADNTLIVAKYVNHFELSAITTLACGCSNSVENFFLMSGFQIVNGLPLECPVHHVPHQYCNDDVFRQIVTDFFLKCPSPIYQ